MGSKISRYIWAGGEGADDRIELLGYCKETPVEVLSATIARYMIHSYKERGCRPIQEYPTNIDGLLIHNARDGIPYGFTITGSMNKLLEMQEVQDLIWDKFTKEQFVKTIEDTKKYADHFDISNSYKKKYETIVADFEIVLKQL